MRWTLTASVIVAACGQEPGLLLTIEGSSLGGSDEVTVRFTAVASDGAACSPGEITLDPSCLPYDLAVSAGSRFDEAFALVASATRGEFEVAHREMVLRLPADDRATERVSLDADCYATCGAGAHCQGAECVPSPDAQAFIDGDSVMIDPASPCLAEMPIGACP